MLPFHTSWSTVEPVIRLNPEILAPKMILESNVLLTFRNNGYPHMYRSFCANPSIYKFGLGVCLFVYLFVCLYPINVKTAESIWPKFCVRLLMTPGKVYGESKFTKISLHQIRFSLNFKNPRFFFIKSAIFF